MKNNIKTIISSFFVVVLCLVFVSGCSIGGEKITCTNTTEENGINEKVEVVASLNNDSISKVSATLSYDSKDDMNTMCNILNNLPSNELRYSCSGNSIKIKNFDKILEFSALNSSKTSFVEQMQQDGFTCN